MHRASRRHSRHHARHRRAHHMELAALAVFAIFTAYVMLLSNTALSATALSTGSVLYASDNPVSVSGLASAGSNSYSIALMWVLSLALLAPVELWLRKR